MRAAVLAVAILVAAVPDMSGATEAQPYWKLRGCDHGYAYSSAARGVRHLMKSPAVLTRERGRRVWGFARCARTRADAGRLARLVRRLRRWRAANATDLAAQRLWAYIRAHPMPACTWVGESGGDYTARNPSSTAGGKYQMLDGTFHSYGGGSYPGSHDAAQAPALEQEIVARRVMWSGWGSYPPQGYGAWVNC